MAGLLILICMLVYGFQSEAFDSSNFPNEVSEWKKSFKSSDFCSNQMAKCQSQIDKAGAKRDKEAKYYGQDIKDAVEMINMYSSEVPRTYEKTNAVLRKDPNKDEREQDDAMFRDYARVLEMSIDILCKSKEFSHLCGKHSPVYRAQSHCISIACPTYIFDGFLSTSKKIEVAEKFYVKCSEPLLLKLTTVEGIYIKVFSEAPWEEEVLIKPRAKFQINTNLNSVQNKSHLTEIEDIIINKLKRTKIPKAYIAGIMIGHRKKRSVTSQKCPTNASIVIYGSKCVGTALAILVVYMLQ